MKATAVISGATRLTDGTARDMVHETLSSLLKISDDELVVVQHPQKEWVQSGPCLVTVTISRGVNFPPKRVLEFKKKLAEGYLHTNVVVVHAHTIC